MDLISSLLTFLGASTLTHLIVSCVFVALLIGLVLACGSVASQF